LKLHRPRLAAILAGSRPARGAWIETTAFSQDSWFRRCRAPRGARGLKRDQVKDLAASNGRAPRGARGLKRLRCCPHALGQPVAPRAGRVD